MFAKDINNLSLIWTTFRDKLHALGYELSTADDQSLDDCAWIFFFDAGSVDGLRKEKNWKNGLKKIFRHAEAPAWPKRTLFQEAFSCGMENSLVLILMEGPIASPRNYDPELWEKFDRIFTWDDNLADQKKFFKFTHPSATSTPLEKTIPFQNKKLLVNITANKASFAQGELYSARRRTIEYFSKNYPDNFDLFGPRWNTPIFRHERWFPKLTKKYSAYKGLTPNKIETASRYKFSLCYENTEGMRGYITEKIFDAFCSHTVPVYLGAPDVHKYINPEAFIDRRHFKTDVDLARFLQKMTEEEYNTMIIAGQKYLQSDAYKKFSPECFCDTIMNTLGITKLR
jgi:hypothetical protein